MRLLHLIYIILLLSVLSGCKKKKSRKINNGVSSNVDVTCIMADSGNQLDSNEYYKNIFNSRESNLYKFNSILNKIILDDILENNCKEYTRYLYHNHVSPDLAKLFIIYRYYNNECYDNSSHDRTKNIEVINDILELFKDSMKVDLGAVGVDKVIYFKGDSVLYTNTQGINKIKYNPMLFTNDYFFDSIDSSSIDTDSKTYLLSKPIFLSNDNAWSITINKVVKEFYQLEYDYELDNSGRQYLYYNDSLPGYVGNKWFYKYLEIDSIKSLYESEFDRQVELIVEGIKKRMSEIEKYTDETEDEYYSIDSNMLEYFQHESKPDFENTELYFTDTTITVTHPFTIGYPLFGYSVIVKLKLDDFLKSNYREGE